MKPLSYFFISVATLVISFLLHIILATGFRIKFNDIQETPTPKMYFIGSILKDYDFQLKENRAHKNNYIKNPQPIPFPFEWIAQESSSHPELNKPKVFEKTSIKENKETLKSIFNDENLPSNKPISEPLGIFPDLEPRKPLRLNP